MQFHSGERFRIKYRLKKLRSTSFVIVYVSVNINVNYYSIIRVLRIIAMVNGFLTGLTRGRCE